MWFDALGRRLPEPYLPGYDTVGTLRYLLDAAGIRAQIEARDLQMDNPYSKDAQVQGIRNARRCLGDRLGRVAAPHKILDDKPPDELAR
jgi:predicted oxidoreductase